MRATVFLSGTACGFVAYACVEMFMPAVTDTNRWFFVGGIGAAVAFGLQAICNAIDGIEED